jgi:hypothetical protein
MTVEVDPETWELSYGIPVAKRREMRAAVGTYCCSLVSESRQPLKALYQGGEYPEAVRRA